MKKLLLTMCAVLLTAMNASARSLVLELTDGSKIYYLIDDEHNPVMTFNDGQLSVEGSNYSFSHIAKFYISETDDPNAIEGVIAKAETAVKDGMVYVKTKGQVKLFSADGRQMNARVSRQGETTVVDAAHLPAGTYILQVNGQAVKFQKK